MVATACGPSSSFSSERVMEGQTLRTFYTQLVLRPKVLHYAQYVLLALRCALLLIPIVWSQLGGGRSLAGAEWPFAGALGGVGGLSSHPPATPSAVCTHALSMEPPSRAVVPLGSVQAITSLLLCLLGSRLARSSCHCSPGEPNTAFSCILH